MAAAGLPDLVKAPLHNLMSPKKVIAGVADENREATTFLAGLAATGVFIPVIDRTYPFAQIRDAHAYVATGHKRGSVVIVM